jgi:Tfp pilus assembly protein FimT
MGAASGGSKYRGAFHRRISQPGDDGARTGDRYSRAMRHGITLTEVLVILTLVSVIFGIGLPRLSAPLDTLAAERAAADLVAAHARARMTAVLQSRVVLLTIGADSLRIAVVTPTDTQQVWGAPGPTRNGVAVEGVTRRLIFSPVGITMGFSNARWVLTKGKARREVVMSRLGRIRVVRNRSRGPDRAGRSGRHRADGTGDGRARGSARPRVTSNRRKLSEG